MIHAVRIQNLRGVRTAQLTNLQPLTIFTGMNGHGKSTVLDALLIGAHPSPALGLASAVTRGSRDHAAVERAARRLIHDGAASAFVAIDADAFTTARTLRVTTRNSKDPQAYGTCIAITHGNTTTTTSIVACSAVYSHGYTIVRDSPQPSGPTLRLVNLAFDGSTAAPPLTRYLEPALQRLGLSALEAALSALLRKLPLDVQNVEVRYPADGVAGLWVKRTDGALPVVVLGAGINALLHIALALTAAAPGSTVLIDSPEAHQHPAVLQATAETIWRHVARGVQVVMATHSLDLIDRLVDAATCGFTGEVVDSSSEVTESVNSSSRPLMALYILHSRDSVLRVSRLSDDAIVYARQEAHTDLR